MNSNTKGSSGEREFTAYLAHNFNIETERLLGQAREGGCDVKHYPFAFEVKRRESLDLRSWWIQVLRAVKDLRKNDLMDNRYGWRPIVAFRQNRKEWEFLISAEHIGLDKGFVRLANHEFKKWFRRELESVNDFGCDEFGYKIREGCVR